MYNLKLLINIYYYYYLSVCLMDEYRIIVYHNSCISYSYRYSFSYSYCQGQTFVIINKVYKLIHNIYHLYYYILSPIQYHYGINYTLQVLQS